MSIMVEEQPSAEITVEQPPVLTLSSNVSVGTGSGSSDYNDLTNKPQINSIELVSNKTLSDLGIQAELVSGTNIKTINSTSLLGSGDIEITVPTKTSDLTNDSGFIDNTVSDLTNYYTETEVDTLITVTDVKFNGSTAVNNKTANITVSPNLNEATTAKLSKLKIGNINYKLSGGGASIYNNYSAMVTAINALPSGELEEGWNVYVLTTDVPDMWISKNNEAISVPYIYTTDTQLLVDMATAGGSLQLGYHRIAQLETEKINIPVQDVKINGTSCVTNNTALIPLASTSDNGVMASTDKSKLDGIEAGAQVNAPNTVIDASYVHTDNNYTTADKTKLDGITPYTITIDA